MVNSHLDKQSRGVSLLVPMGRLYIGKDFQRFAGTGRKEE